MKSFLFIVALLLVIIKKNNSQQCFLLDGQLYYQGCKLLGGQCTFTINQNLECINTYGCRFQNSSGNCIDQTGQCEKKGCCLIAGQLSNGQPFCKCNLSISPQKCPNCIKAVDLTTIDRTIRCFDTNNICKNQNKCCQLKKMSAWDVCSCEISNSCSSCRFDKQKWTCIDYNGQCESQGLCCDVHYGQYDPVTGQPVCKCFKNNFCSKCQKCIAPYCPNKCYDPSQTCNENNSLCCKLQNRNGYEICICNVCPQKKDCFYNQTVKSCFGNCLNGQQECCQFTGKYEYTSLLNLGDPICQCLSIPISNICSDCKYNSSLGICVDTTGICGKNQNGCCTLDTNSKICICKDCQTTIILQKCYLEEKSGQCINQGCQTCCKKNIDKDNKQFCQCTQGCQSPSQPILCSYNQVTDDCQIIQCKGCCQKIFYFGVFSCQCTNCYGYDASLTKGN